MVDDAQDIDEVDRALEELRSSAAYFDMDVEWELSRLESRRESMPTEEWDSDSGSRARYRDGDLSDSDRDIALLFESLR